MKLAIVKRVKKKKNGIYAEKNKQTNEIQVIEFSKKLFVYSNQFDFVSGPEIYACIDDPYFTFLK